MPFLSKTITNSLYTTLSRYLSTAATATATATNLPKSLNKIHIKYRSRAIEEAQNLITDYLHTTRALPYAYAEHIGKNSLFSLSDVVSKVRYTPSTFYRTLQKFLSYHPINEFEFFYESIGISHSEVRGFLPPNKFFFSEDGSALNAAFSLSDFGFPWNKLGLLYKGDSSIFGKDPNELSVRLSWFKGFGFNNATVIGICLVFPRLLIGECKSGGEIDALFDDLKRVFLEFDLMNCVEENVDSFYEVCCKIQVFYDMGCEKGKVGELMGRSKNIFVEYSEQVLVQKMDFFCRLGVGKEEVGWLILCCPEILNFDLEERVISVLGFLKQFGMSTKELRSVTLWHPHILGKNKLANLPHVMRALDLHQWFFDKMKNGNHHLLGSYIISGPDEDKDEEFTEGLERIRSSKYHVHTLLKLDFMHRIGFGENGLTFKILAHMHGTSSELQERFDCLLCMGVDYSKLCRIISLSPKILNQKPEIIQKKVNFLCQEMGSSLQYLGVFPALLNFDLENRIKPRYRFHTWLTERLIEKGFCATKYSIASIVATSEKNFIERISGIHPAAPKQWFECFSYKKPRNSCKET